MNNNLITISLLPILTAVISSYLTYYFTNRSKRREAILKFKEERYLNLLIFLEGFAEKTAPDEWCTDMQIKFFEELYKSWLYSSDKVVKAINKMVKLVFESGGKAPDPEKEQKAIGDIVLEMRKDLLGKTKLNSKDFQYTDVL